MIGRCMGLGMAGLGANGGDIGRSFVRVAAANGNNVISGGENLVLIIAMRLRENYEGQSIE